ncbi:MAG: hypothetical protein U0228_34470 [Myxococcaceae bacterium]
MRSLWLLPLVVVLVGCKPARPASAMDLCHQLTAKFDGKHECRPLVRADELAPLEAEEVAVMYRVEAGKAGGDVAWVGYTEGLPNALRDRTFAESTSETRNEHAHIRVNVAKGKLAPEAWADLEKLVGGFRAL